MRLQLLFAAGASLPEQAFSTPPAAPLSARLFLAPAGPSAARGSIVAQPAMVPVPPAVLPPASPAPARPVARRRTWPGAAAAVLLGASLGAVAAALQTSGTEKVAAISSLDELSNKLALSREGRKSAHQDGDLLCIKFYSSWCKACKAIAPKYNALAEEHDDQAYFYEMRFSKELKDVFSELGVTKMPCVQFYRGATGRLATVVCGPRKWADVRDHLQMYLEDNDTDVEECELNAELTECISRLQLQPTVTLGVQGNDN